jgi:NAD(P)-dependent dehydrogenase (short-subunit alcohol dehydrogenase family)
VGRHPRHQSARADAAGQGLIVNVVDQRVWRLNPQFFSYTLSKAALWTATQTLAQALAPRIRVNAIGPGPTLASVHQTPEAFAAEAAAIPLQHAADVAEMGEALTYLIGARSVTGQMIAVDGGQHLAWRTPDVIG